jgi:hypothetical protein
MKSLITAILITFPVYQACASPPSSASPCHQAVDAIWQKDRSWAHGVVNRESHGNPTAQNRKSSAAGCFQLLRLHADLLPGGWAARYDAGSNVTGAWRLYLGSGRDAWS